MWTKRIAVLVSLLLLFAVPASAQVAFGAGGTNGADNGGATSSVSWSFDTGLTAAATDVLFVTLQGDTSMDDISGVTYNSVSMTLVAKVQPTGGRWAYLYRLFAPATGSHTVAVSAGSTHYLFGTAASYSGVASLGTPQSAGTSSNATTQSVTVVTTAANSWIVSGSGGGAGVQAGTGATNNRALFGSFVTPGIFDAGNIVSSGTSTQVDATSLSGSAPLSVIAVELKSASPPAGGVLSLLLLGV